MSDQAAEASPVPTAADPQPAPSDAAFADPKAAAESVKEAKAATKNPQEGLDTKAMPIRQYLEATVVPTVMQAMQEMVKERPDNPLQYMAAYLAKAADKEASPAKAAGDLKTEAAEPSNV